MSRARQFGPLLAQQPRLPVAGGTREPWHTVESQAEGHSASLSAGARRRPRLRDSRHAAPGGPPRRAGVDAKLTPPRRRANTKNKVAPGPAIFALRTRYKRRTRRYVATCVEHTKLRIHRRDRQAHGLRVQARSVTQIHEIKHHADAYTRTTAQQHATRDRSHARLEVPGPCPSRDAHVSGLLPSGQETPPSPRDGSSK